MIYDIKDLTQEEIKEFVDPEKELIDPNGSLARIRQAFVKLDPAKESYDSDILYQAND